MGTGNGGVDDTGADELAQGGEIDVSDDEELAEAPELESTARPDPPEGEEQ